MGAFTEWMPKLGLKEAKDKRIIFKLLAEMLGTMVLVFFSCGSAQNIESSVVRYSLTFGFTVATMAQAIGHVSGCHINPAVTIGLFVGRKIGLVPSVLYIIAQCIGALIGAALLLAIQVENVTHVGDDAIPGITKLVPGLGVGQGILIEFVITFVLIITVYAAAADEQNLVNGSAPLAIGLAITIGHLFAGPYTGPSMNPARSFGPAVVGNNFENHWVYWIGPILGGIAGALTYQLAFQAKNFKEGYLPPNDVEMK